MTTLYKLTDDKDRTYGDTQWGAGITHTASGTGKLCSAGWIHAYTDPLLGLLLNGIHGAFRDPHMWRSEGDIGKTDCGLKVGCASLTTLVRMENPQIATVNRVAFGILCALQVYQDPEWVIWAEGWLADSNHSRTDGAAARAVARAVYAAGAVHAMYAAQAAADAAHTTVCAVDAAYTTADAAAHAAYAATADLDLAGLARQAMKVR
jgi:hypothetical protein